MIAAEIIGQVLAAGGQIAVDSPDLVLRAPHPLPPALLDQIKVHKCAILESLAHIDLLPPLSPAAEARRGRVLAIQARDGTRYALLVEDPNTDPVIMALATPDGTCEIQIPRDRYDPFALLARMEGWEA